MPITKLAYIEEESCIGCTKCIDVCPVDAILGSEQFMHTVIQQECIGCELCVPACPID
ncbi:MAG: Electron transport complex protein RnfB, partial [uncultured bacterium]